MDSANAMNGTSYCIQKGGAATGHVVFLGHGTHAFQGQPVMNDVDFCIKEDGGDQCISFSLFLLFHHRIEPAPGVFLQPVHRTTAIQNENKFSQLGIHSCPPWE